MGVRELFSVQKVVLPAAPEGRRQRRPAPPMAAPVEVPPVIAPAPDGAAEAPVAVDEQPPAQPNGKVDAPAVVKENEPLFLTAKTLTFPGVAVVGGTILNFITKNTGVGEGAIWIALAIAVVFGGFLIFLGITDEKNKERKAVQLFVGVINTALLWITLWGVSSI